MNFGNAFENHLQVAPGRPPVFGMWPPQDCDHVLVELRDVGYIEVSGLEASTSPAKALHEPLVLQWL